jgi:hypothetical protein
VEGSSERGNEPSGSIKCWEILESLSGWSVLKYSAPCSKLVVTIVYINIWLTTSTTITHSLKHSPSLEANSRSATQ